jgi:hypothetical protein
MLRQKGFRGGGSKAGLHQSTAAFVRFTTTPSNEKNAAWSALKPARLKRSASVCHSKSTGAKVSESETAISASRSRARFQNWVAGWSTSLVKR